MSSEKKSKTPNEVLADLVKSVAKLGLDEVIEWLHNQEGDDHAMIGVHKARLCAHVKGLRECALSLAYRLLDTEEGRHKSIKHLARSVALMNLHVDPDGVLPPSRVNLTPEDVRRVGSVVMDACEQLMLSRQKNRNRPIYVVAETERMSLGGIAKFFLVVTDDPQVCDRLAGADKDVS